MLLVLLVGAAGGVGLWMLVLLLVPERSDLVTALSRPRGLTAPATFAVEPAQQPERRSVAVVQAWMEQRLAAAAWLVTPDRDLMVIEMSRGTFLLVRVAASGAALLVGPIYSLVFLLIGFRLPLVVPAAVGLILAGVTWLTVGVVVHAQAESRRREMRYALVSYLTLVALHRAAGQAMGKSLELAAMSSSSAWTFQRIAQRMSLATRSGSNEWAGLAGLAAELGIDELSDLASIADTAGVAGAGVYSTLMARAQSLRHELQTKEEEAAAAASTRLAIPKVILTFTTFVFLLYPALMQLVG